MPVTLMSKTYYRTAEVCRMVGISKSTLFRWLREGLLVEVELRDRRGWRLFSEGEVEKLKKEANQISKAG